MTMYLMIFLKTWYFYLSLKGIVSLSANLNQGFHCPDPITGKMKCCADYRNVSGRCEPCLGSFGLDCNRTCQDGYYGHGCKTKCECLPTESCHKVHGCLACIQITGSFGENCSEPCPFGFFGINCLEKCNCSSGTHWCDNISGCKLKDSVDVNNRNQENKTKHLAFVVVGSIIGTSAFWFFIYLMCSWKRRSNKTMKVTMKEDEDSGNSPGESQRECNTPSVESGRHVRSKSLRHEAKKTEPVTRSKSHSQDTYGRFNRHSENYDHLDFRGHHNQPSMSAFSSNYSKINLKP
ncbi:protein draper-like isoform X2 [Ostrea edulis]|uniref:protein draper-like isoform X2 n=1 Tax=Ostrea edulis TaxID=37623 RepID=UPI0024AEE9CE|nr:protein draper-like isoform X2 [Ostrea edulis]